MKAWFKKIWQHIVDLFTYRNDDDDDNNNNNADKWVSDPANPASPLYNNTIL